MPSSDTHAAPQVHAARCGGLLFNPGTGVFELDLQQRLWALHAALRAHAVSGVTESVPGVNNLLVMLDTLTVTHEAVSDQVLALWDRLPGSTLDGKTHVVWVDYGGSVGEDLQAACAHTGLSAQALVELHCSRPYIVACLGSMPGFAYLVGMSERLAVPRRQSPRTMVPKGSVMIGGAQTGIQPITAPSGWNILGRTDTALFDPQARTPCLLAPGDRVQFQIRSLTS